MKKNRTTRLIVLVLFLAIVTSVIISGTFAKYTETATKDSTAAVAKWVFNADDSNLGKVVRTDGVTADKIVADKLAPGTQGTIKAALNLEGCEVAVDYVVEISNIQNKPQNLKFYKDEACTTEIAAVDGKYKIEGTVAATAITSDDIAANIYWKWDYETGADDAAKAANDAKDTTDGKNAANMTFSVAIVATQHNPTVAIPAP